MRGMEDDGRDDQMRPSSDTPYMRRQRAVAVRQSRVPRGIRRIVWWAAVILFIFLPLGVGGTLLGRYLLSSPRFQVASPTDVMVEGNHYVSRDEILAALNLPAGSSGPGKNIFRSSLVQREREVETIPWIKSATVVRSYPHNLAVYVTERVPVAFVDVGGRIRMVDQEGTLLDTPQKSHFDFPVVKGLDFQGSIEDRATRLNLYEKFISEASAKIASSGWTVSEVDLRDAANLKALLVLRGQTLLVYFGHADFLERFENLVSVLPQLRKTNATIDSVDLRFRNQVVVNPAGEGSGSGPASGSVTAGK